MVIDNKLMALGNAECVCDQDDNFTNCEILTSIVMIAESVSLGVLSLPATMTALGLVP